MAVVFASVLAATMASKGKKVARERRNRPRTTQLKANQPEAITTAITLTNRNPKRLQ